MRRNLLPGSLTAEVFVRSWQAADNLADLAKHLGMPPRDATMFAGRLRRNGVPLKKMNRWGVEPLDYDALATVARGAPLPLTLVKK